MKKYKDEVSTPYGVIPITVTIKGVKNLSVHLSRNGEVLVSAPYLTPQSMIRRFIEANSLKILEAMKKSAVRADVNSVSDTLTLWGKRYDIVYKKGSPRIVYGEETVTVYYPDENYQNYVEAQLRKLLSREVESRRQKYDDIIAGYRFAPPEIRYRTMTSQWGNCRPKQQRVTLNTRLIHYPKECLEYVMLHEYMHFIEPNHSKSFHALLKYHMPSYRQIEKMLK